MPNSVSSGGGLSFRVDARDFGRLSRHLKAVAPELRKDMRRRINAACKPIVTEMRANVMGLAVHGGGTAGGYGIAGAKSSTSLSAVSSGGMARAQHSLRRGFTHSGYTAMDVARGQRRTASALRRSGLRRSVAASVRIIQRDSFSGTAITVKSEGSRMPADQTKLPAYMDKGTWRHPVFGHTNSWADQYATPVGWFTKTADESKPRLVRVVTDIVNDFARRAAAL